MKVNEYYTIIYDDKGFKPVKKYGRIHSIDGNLIEMSNGEILNKLFIIRAEKSLTPFDIVSETKTKKKTN